jgi:Flp pilus assembly pilin Flp
MDLFTKAFLKVRERFVRFHRAQTMTEYALILAAIAIVVYGTYKVLGNSIGSLASGVDSALTNA